MKKVSIYYPKLDNMGDLLNVYILRDIFGYQASRQMPITCSISCIGSGLGLYTLTDNHFINVGLKISGIIFPTVHIWGTGFVRNNINKPFYRKNMVFCALRGEMTKKKVEDITGKKLGNITLCDGGILASELLHKKPETKYDVGIIPHFRQNESAFVKRLKNKYSNSLVINLKEDVIKVIKDIGSCDTIISSSLHGIIVADSFHIPNIHLNVTHGMRGDGFKFDDYYTSFGIPHNLIGEDDDITLEYIKSKYLLNPDKIELKKEQMKKAFPVL